MIENPNIHLIILAAGQASRMGHIKQLLPWGNSTLIEHVIKHGLESKVAKVSVVLGAYLETIKPKVEHFKTIEILKNDEWKSGMLSSLQSGIASLTPSADAAIIILVDQPAIDSGYINELIENYIANDRTIVATKYNSNCGVPVLFDKIHFKKLLKLSRTDGGAQKYINTNIEVTRWLKPGFDLYDIDTEEEYNRRFQQNSIEPNR